MSSGHDDMLPPEIVAEVVRNISDEEDAFVVGGQAINFWAQRYERQMTALNPSGSYMSKDVDIYGPADAAQRLADKLGGKIRVPDADDHTPQSAIVEATVLGRKVEIDFLWHIQGPPIDQIEKQIVTLQVPVNVDGTTTNVPVSVMHPLHCLQSRAANVLTLGRKTPQALDQLDASIHIVRCFVSEALDTGQTKTATSVLKALGSYLVTDPNGCRLHEKSSVNPVEILRAFRQDDRLEKRYRDNQLEGMIGTIEANQKQRETNAAMRAAHSSGLAR